MHRDFNAPTPSADTSAATIAATSLLLLAQMEMSLSPANSTGRDFWSNAAIKVRRALVPTPTSADNYNLVEHLDSGRHDYVSMAADVAELIIKWYGQQPCIPAE